MRKAIIYLAATLALQGIAFFLALPMWIPEWTLVPWILGVVAYLSSGFFAYRLLRLAHAKMKAKLDPAPRTITTTVFAILLAGWLAFAGFVTAFIADGGIFAPVYITQYEFSDPDTILYVYDGSFLDPQTDLYVQAGVWPWMRLVARIPNAQLWEEAPTQEGTWAVWPYFRYNLATGHISD